MRVRDKRLRPRIGHRPEHTGGLRNGEGEVVARNRPARPACGLLGLDCYGRLRTAGRPKVGIERGDALRDPLGHGLVGRILQPERSTRNRVPTETEEEFELAFGDLIALRDHPAKRRDASAKPLARWSANLGVIARQRGREQSVAVARNDRA